jgi:hypothetical protein
MSEMLEKFAGHVIAMLENVMVISFLFFLLAAIVGIFKSGSATRMERRLGALLRVEAKINLLLEQAGIEFDPYKTQESQFLFTKPSGKLACFACPAARR